MKHGRLFEDPWIYWPHQCDLCQNQGSKYFEKECERNQKFMEKLKNRYGEYLGTCEFKCDYFSFDEEKFKNNKFYNQNSCCG